MNATQYRMSPTQLNILLTSVRDEQMELMKKDQRLVEEMAKVEEKTEVGAMTIIKKVAPGQVELKETKHGKDVTLDFFIVEREFPTTSGEIKEICTKKYVVFNIAKDSANPEVEPNLGYIGDVIQTFRRRFPDERDATLLIPLRQCRGFLRMDSIWFARREHIVLAEVTPKGDILEHDSQTQLRATLYSDLSEVAKELGGVSRYIPYGTQKGEYECGYFVYGYINAILAAGDSKYCADVQVTHEHVEKTHEHLVALCKAEEMKMEEFAKKVVVL